MAEEFTGLNLLKYIKKELNEGFDEVRAVVLGEMAAGKSHLINKIFNTIVAEEAGGPNAISKETKEYKRSQEYNGKEYNMTIVDTPGFGDPSYKNEEEELEALSADVECCHLVIYCISIVTRIGRDTIKILNTLNAKGEKFWKKTVIVFTHVDEGKEFNQEVWVKTIEKYVPNIIKFAKFANSGDEKDLSVQIVSSMNEKARMCWLIVGGFLGGVGLSGLAKGLSAALATSAGAKFLAAPFISKVVALMPALNPWGWGIIGAALGVFIIYIIYKKYFEKK